MPSSLEHPARNPQNCHSSERCHSDGRRQTSHWGSSTINPNEPPSLVCCIKAVERPQSRHKQQMVMNEETDIAIVVPVHSRHLALPVHITSNALHAR